MESRRLLARVLLRRARLALALKTARRYSRVIAVAGVMTGGIAVTSIVHDVNPSAAASVTRNTPVRPAVQPWGRRVHRPPHKWLNETPVPHQQTTTASTSTTALPKQSSPVSSAPPPTTVPQTGLRSTIGIASEPQVVRHGPDLRELDPHNPSQYLPGKFRFTGVDAYELTTDWSINYGCGSDLSDGDMLGLFHSLGTDAVVRTWFFEALATNKYTGALDWTGLDRVVSLASQAGVHLIVTLGNQDGVCDDSVWKGPSWYSAGYQQPEPHRLSFAQWTSSVVARYKDSPAILAWEPVNEPRPDTCTDAHDCWDHRVCPSTDAARNALRSFFDAIGGEIRSIDPNHLISDGAPPVESCGAMTWNDLQYLESSPGIDLMSFHDYSGFTSLAASTVADYNQIAAAIGKPLFAGENGGVNAMATGGGTPSCPSLTNRANGYAPKIAAEFSSLASFTGWLFWNAGLPPPTSTNETTCQYGTWQGDPLLGLLVQQGQAARARP